MADLTKFIEMAKMHDMVRLPDLAISFKGLSDGDFILKLRHLAPLFESHPAYRHDGLPPWIHGGPHFREHADLMTEALEVAANDKTLEPAVAAARERAVKSIQYAVQYVVMYSDHQQDPTPMGTLGLEFKQKAYGKNKNVPGKPTKYSVKNGKDSGDIIIQINNGFGSKGSVEVQMTTGDPADEGSWRLLGHYLKCKIEVSGLEPVKKYYFRARFQNTAGYGPWSDVVVLVVG